MKLNGQDLIYLLFLTCLSKSSVALNEPLTEKGLKNNSSTFHLNLALYDDKNKKISLPAYDKSLYETSFKVYLKNKNFNKAYIVALAATEQNKSNALWKNRLEQLSSQLIKSSQSTLAKNQKQKNFEFSLEVNGDKEEKVQLMSYDRNLYELAYAVYLQSGNLNKAFILASAAVKQEPHDKQWRSRLRQVALWVSMPTVALNQNIYLAKHFNDPFAQEEGLKLAKQLNYDLAYSWFLHRDISKTPSSDELWKKYIDVMFKLGNLKQLALNLDFNVQQMSKLIYFNAFIKIYKLADDPDGQLGVLKRAVSVLGPQADYVSQIATIYTTRGDFKRAWDIVQQGKKTAKANDIDFWSTYAQVAYLNQKTSDEIFAQKKLLDVDNPLASTFTRVLELTADTDPNRAFEYVRRGLKLYPDDMDLNSRFFLLLSDRSDLIFEQSVAGIPRETLKLLQFDTSYWLARTNYWKQLQNNPMIIDSYLTAIKNLPYDDTLKANFMGYLLDTENYTLVKYLMAQWQDDLVERPEMWDGFAESYSRFADPMRARLVLSYFYDNFQKYENNPYWLILFKDALENSFYDRESKNVNAYAWPIYLSLLEKQKVPPTYIQILDYVKLSMYSASGDATGQALNRLQDYENVEVELLLLTWALEHNNISLAKHIYSNYKFKHVEPPLWTVLSIAMPHNDRPLMKKILLKGRKIASYRDKVQAALNIDAIPLAQTIAYNELKMHRKDSDLYDNYFTPAMFRTADSFSAGEEYEQYGTVVGPRTKLSYTYFLMPSLSLTPHGSVWFTSNQPGVIDSEGNNNQEVATVPNKDEQFGLRFATPMNRGDLSVDFGYRKDASSFFTSQIKRNYTIYSNLSVLASAGYHIETDDTAALLVAGMKNDLDLEFNYHVFTQDYLVTRLQQNAFYTQNNQFLANGTQLTLQLEHKLNLSYPDWTITPYGVVTSYYNKTPQALYGNVLNLIPEGGNNGVDFFIPQSSKELGLTFSFGQEYIEEYSHQWRPFALTTVSYNSVFGLGELLNLGLTGSVFGRDKLLLYYEYGLNQGQGLQVTQLARLNYKIYV